MTWKGKCISVNSKVVFQASLAENGSSTHAAFRFVQAGGDLNRDYTKTQAMQFVLAGSSDLDVNCILKEVCRGFSFPLPPQKREKSPNADR